MRVGNLSVSRVYSTLHITKSSATALVVTKSTSETNYAFQVDTSAVSAKTGLKVTAKAAAGGLTLAVISSGTNESLAIDAKGSGTVALNATGTGAVVVGSSLSIKAATEAIGAGSMNIKTLREVVTMAGATCVTTFNIPAGSLLLGASFTVNTQVTDSGATHTWSAAYSGGSTAALAAAAARAVNTKVNAFSPTYAVASATTNITFTPQTANFVSGAIEVVAYYADLTSLANA